MSTSRGSSMGKPHPIELRERVVGFVDDSVKGTFHGKNAIGFYARYDV